jgi:hypothetical protein
MMLEAKGRRSRLRRCVGLLGAAVSVAVVLGGAAIAGASRADAAAQPDSLARVEAAYARAVSTLADSAIRQLDFFPTRAQVRVQMAFLDARRSAELPFEEIAQRSVAAAEVVGTLGERLDALTPPADLAELHAKLAGTLRDARAALDQLATTSQACRAIATSVARCQTPFTSASSQLALAYKRYLDARVRIGDQITDTGTRLPDFRRVIP